MLSLTRLVPKNTYEGPLPRLWLVFFREGEGGAWWRFAFRRGFRHIVAAAWYDREQRWVCVDPSWRGTVIQIYEADEFGPKFEHLLRTSSVTLRVASRFDRGGTPAAWHCVGAIKALLGVRACALGPYSLYRHLRRHGAEIVEVPARDEPIQRPAGPAAGRSSDCAAATA